MGGKESKELIKEEEEEEDSFAYDPLKIYWDVYGNLRYGEAHEISPPQQLVEIMELDYETDDPEISKTWYIIDSVWLASWLSYTHRNLWQAPSPGPCRNDRLIRWDPEGKKYIGRFGLMIASQLNPRGDYRKVSKLTWDKYKEFYPESGPTITLTLNETNIKDTNQYPLFFEILDPPMPPIEKKSKKSKKKQKDIFNDLKPMEESKQNSNNNINDDNIDLQFQLRFGIDDHEYESNMIPPKENMDNHINIDTTTNK